MCTPDDMLGDQNLEAAFTLDNYGRRWYILNEEVETNGGAIATQKFG